jgi:phosphoenolpyruvate-protein kinase (PTS system EI component)
MMVEIPSAVVLIERFLPEVDFISVGSNDLTQYTLAMDRGEPALAGHIDGLHPAVVTLIGRVGEAAVSANISAGVCGGLASDPVAVPILLGLGISKLSVTLSMIAPVKAIIRSLDIGQCRDIATKAQTLNSPAEVRQLVLNEWPHLDRWL